MLTKKELAEIRQRFEAAGADKPLRIEGEHIKVKDGAIDLGWRVLSAEGRGLKLQGKEYPVVYADHTTFEAATFLVRLPVDFQQMLADLEYFHLLLAGLLAGDEEVKQVAEFLVTKHRQEREG